MADDNGNPFTDDSLTNHPSVEAQPADGNPFNDPALSLPESVAAQTGQVTNDVGNTVIVPKDGESFADTMKRAAAYGKTVTQDQINKETATAPKKVATVLAAAPAIGFGGAAALAAPGELYELAIKHLAGNVLPGMETEAAKQTLMKAVPYVGQLLKLGIGYEGAKHLFNALTSSQK